MANEFYGALFEHVKVIWYEAPDDVDSTTLFTRLNVGRIPLTDAELVKALLLSREPRAASATTDRALEIAAQWDGIERDLRDPEVWAFVTGEADEEPDPHQPAARHASPAGPTGATDRSSTPSRRSAERIDERPSQVLDEVVDLHSLVLGWYEDRDLFHKIGYLIADGARRSASSSSLPKGKRRRASNAALDGRIRDSPRSHGSPACET